ncbi:putative hydrolase [Candidatus Rhodobacter oscarellae]|uniref:Putative hydrolase n=1 Tax=Candidatus Rhodobacter oscarellae TaxID=1675527 RepID=A0A0J9E5V2_9RHOB|nr:alpha/beta hydrolase [Candidatus Rhodobacter lobularis]KMW58120.1 putative hydrolase [Candidatus Rhodobacter lobularis]
MSWVTGHNGVRLHVATAGDPAAPALLLIHGWSQCHLSWTKQLEGPLADRFFLVAPDLRGHGASDKPDAPEAYDNSAPWAGDIAAIIDQLDLNRPLLVGWSMGGKVMLDYLAVHGDAALAGVALVGSAVTSGRSQPAEAAAQRGADVAVAAQGMYSEDLGANLAATLAFVKACTAQPVEADTLAWMMGYNMLCPPHIRAAARLRHDDYRDVARATRAPALVLWGDQDRPMPRALFDESVACFADPHPVVFEGIGHSPFWEAPERFDQVLGDFAAAQHRRDTDAIPT